MKKILYIPIILILFCLIGCNNSYIINTDTKKTEDYDIRLQLPEYKAYSIFNKYIKDYFEKDVSSYEVYAEKENENNLLYSFERELFTYKTTFEDCSTSRYLNILVRKYIYAGPNMEDEYLISFNYDKKNKKILTLFDVINISKDKLCAKCIDELKKQYAVASDYDKSAIYDSIDMSFDDQRKGLFDAFSVDKKNIIIYFAPDIVIPKGFGEQKVEIDRGSL